MSARSTTLKCLWCGCICCSRNCSIFNEITGERMSLRLCWSCAAMAELSCGGLLLLFMRYITKIIHYAVIRRSPQRFRVLRCWGRAGCSAVTRSSDSTSCPAAAGPNSDAHRSRCGSTRIRSISTQAAARSRRSCHRCSRARPLDRQSLSSSAHQERWWLSCRGGCWKRRSCSRGSGLRTCCFRGCSCSRKCGCS